MNRIETLARKFEEHISLPWQPHLATAEKTVFVVYPKEDERRLRGKRDLFGQACRKAGYGWGEIWLDPLFPEWMMSQEYADEYFRYTEDIRQKLEIDFTEHVASRLRSRLDPLSEKHALGVFGVGTLFGLTHLSSVLKQIEGAVRGRLVIFFPGSYEKNVYRLLDARDGWGYMAYPITLNEVNYP